MTFMIFVTIFTIIFFFTAFCQYKRQKNQLNFIQKQKLIEKGCKAVFLSEIKAHRPLEENKIEIFLSYCL